MVHIITSRNFILCEASEIEKYTTASAFFVYYLTHIPFDGFPKMAKKRSREDEKAQKPAKNLNKNDDGSGDEEVSYYKFDVTSNTARS